jgi:hypothetical protein
VVRTTARALSRGESADSRLGSLKIESGIARQRRLVFNGCYSRNVRKSHGRKIGQVAAKGDPRRCRGDVSGASVSNLADASSGNKMTKQQAEYRDTPNGIYSGGLCTLFDKPKSCKVVEGEVSEDGWCKAFALAD